MAPATEPVRASGTTGSQLTIRRVFDAPREMVFKLWTDPAHAIRWMGPLEYPAVLFDQDVRVGGKWRGCLRSLEDPSDERWQGGEFLEITPPERLVFTFRWDDGESDTVVTLAFNDLGDGKTEMLFHQTGFVNADSRDGHNEGWSSAFDVLVRYLRLGEPDGYLQHRPRKSGVQQDIDVARKRMWADQNLKVNPETRKRPEVVPEPRPARKD